MTQLFVNERFLSRLDELIQEGEKLWEEYQSGKSGKIMNAVGFSQWSTSCLNILDKLSISTNRFVTQFEPWVTGGGKPVNIGGALGVLKSAKHEYSCGLAIEFQLSVSAVVFSSLLDQAGYLLEKGYTRAAVVLLGGALEEGLKARARAIPIALSPRETLTPVINKLKAPDVGVLNEFEAKQLEAIARLRNDAAHGGDFNYTQTEVTSALRYVEEILRKFMHAA